MTQLYTIAAPGVTFQPNKCLVGLFNGVGSERVIRIYSVWMLNNQTVGITGVPLLLTLDLFSTGSGGVAIVPVKHDTEYETLPSQIVAATNLTYTSTSTFRRVCWSSDEPVAATANSIDEICTNPWYTQLLDYTECLNNETDIQPLTLREGQGFGVINTTNTIVGLCDLFVVISVEET